MREQSGGLGDQQAVRRCTWQGAKAAAYATTHPHPLPPHPLTHSQDTGSRSALVRAYYRHRLFMGFCCVSCEALYLTLYLLAWPAPREWGPSLTLPAALAPLLNGGCRAACEGWW